MKGGQPREQSKHRDSETNEEAEDGGNESVEFVQKVSSLLHFPERTFQRVLLQNRHSLLQLPEESAESDGGKLFRSK